MTAAYLSFALLAGSAWPNGMQPVLDPDGYQVYHLDFEVASDDRDLNGRLDEDRWERLQGRAYPFYCRAALDDRAPHAGEMSLFLDPDGASVGVRTRLLPVDRHVSLRVAGHVRTKNLRQSAAWVHVEWLTQDGAQVLGRSSSGPLQGTADWRPFDVSARPPQDLRLRAFRLVFSVEAGRAGSDLDAGAWFDAVTVREQPRLSLTTGEPANLFETGREKSLTCLVSGLKVPGRARLIVTDRDGRRLQAREVPLRADSAGSAVVRFPIDLDRPGVYFAEVHIRREESDEVLARVERTGPGTRDPGPVTPDPGTRDPRPALETARPPLATQTAWLAIAPGPGLRSGPSDLGISLAAGETAAAHLPAIQTDPPAVPLERLLRRVGCRWAKVPVHADDDGRTLQDLIGRLDAAGVSLVGVFDGTPNAAVTAADILRDTGERFRTAAAAYGGRIRAWQVGADGDGSLRPGYDLEADLARISGTMRSVAIAPEVGLAWNPLYPLPPVGPDLDFISLHIGSEIPPSLVAEQVGRPSTAADAAGPSHETPITATIGMLDRTRFSPEACLRDLVLRVVAAKQAGARRVFVAPLRDDRIGLLRSDGSPTETLLAWRTLIEMLDGLPFLGSAPTEGGVANALFGDAERAVLVAWSDDGPRTARLWLDRGAVLVSLFGERQPIPGAGDECDVAVGPLPVFITGVDPGLAATCASFALDPPFLECAYRPQVRSVRLTNRFTLPVRGRLILSEPPGWRIDPKVLAFDLAPGAHLERSVRVVVPYTAAGGPAVLRGQLEVPAHGTPGGTALSKGTSREPVAPAPTDEPLPGVRDARSHRAVIQAPLRLEVAGLSLAGVCDSVRDGRVLLRMTLRNTGATRFSGTCTASAPGLLAAEGGGFILEPGTQVEKRFFLDFGPAALPRSIRLSVREARGDRFLNADVGLPAPDDEWRPLVPPAKDGGTIGRN